MAVDVNEGRLRILTEAAQQQGVGDVVMPCHYDLRDYAVCTTSRTSTLNFYSSTHPSSVFSYVISDLNYSFVLNGCISFSHFRDLKTLKANLQPRRLKILQFFHICCKPFVCT